MVVGGHQCQSPGRLRSPTVGVVGIILGEKFASFDMLTTPWTNVCACALVAKIKVVNSHFDIMKVS